MMPSIGKDLFGRPLSGSAPNATPATGNDAGTPADPDDLSGATGVGLRDAVLSGWYRQQTHEIFRGVPVGPGDTVVDVGCGPGGNSLFCARQGARVTAIDVNPDVVNAIRSKLAQIDPHAHAAMVSDANPLPLADSSANRIVCTEVLEHVEDPDQVLAELVRIGKPGALYLVTVPGELQEHMQEHVAPKEYFQRPNHIRIIERDQFAEMVSRAGLIIQEHTQYGFFWSIWWALFWACKVDADNPSHPALDHWTEAWRAILELPDDSRIKQQLDAFMPKSQIIVARKP